MQIQSKLLQIQLKKKKNECDFPNMTWQESKENSKILTEWKSRI